MDAKQVLEEKIALAVIGAARDPALPADAAPARPIIDAVSEKIAPAIVHATNNESIRQSR